MGKSNNKNSPSPASGGGVVTPQYYNSVCTFEENANLVSHVPATRKYNTPPSDLTYEMKEIKKQQLIVTSDTPDTILQLLLEDCNNAIRYR